MSLARIPLLRLARSRKAAGALGVLALGALATAWAQRSAGEPHGADRVLELFASAFVPLLAYTVVAAVLGGRGLAASARPLVRLGAPRQRVALFTVATAVTVAAAVCGAVGALVVVGAHGSGDPPLARDAVQTLGITALAGGAYASLLLFGAALAEGAWLRVTLLVVDALLGAGEGLGAALVPRGHLRNLLGGEAPFDLAPNESTGALLVFLALLGALAVRRAARARV